jgi:hypothetical protein
VLSQAGSEAVAYAAAFAVQAAGLLCSIPLLRRIDVAGFAKDVAAASARRAAAARGWIMSGACDDGQVPAWLGERGGRSVST